MGSFLTGLGAATRGLSVLDQLYVSFDTVAAEITNFAQPFRPPQWNQANQATLAMVVANSSQQSVTLPGSQGQAGFLPLPSAPPFSATQTVVSGSTLYVFDAVLRAEHRHESVITKFPVQTSGVISDHAFNLPSALEIEIKMSDAMQAYIPGQWADNPGGKSVSAYQTLLKLKHDIRPVSVSTRLNTYDFLLIQEVRGIEEKSTRYGARIFVRFVEILNAHVEQTSSSITYSGAMGGANPISSRTQSTDYTIGGTTASQPVPPPIFSQHNIASAAPSVAASIPAVPGAGQWGSAAVGALKNLF